MGEYDADIHVGNYISEHKLLLKQTETIEEKALELHQTQLKGFTAEQAETHFLRLASQLDTYAVDPHPVKVSKRVEKNKKIKKYEHKKVHQFSKKLFY